MSFVWPKKFPSLEPADLNYISSGWLQGAAFSRRRRRRKRRRKERKNRKERKKRKESKKRKKKN
jgi:hypothetical protein